MVSLIGSGKKGMSFEEPSDESNASEDEEFYRIADYDNHDILITSPNHYESLNSILLYKRVNTLWISGFMGILTIGIFIISVVLPYECDNYLSSTLHPFTSSSNSTIATHSILCFMKPLSFVLYSQTIMWGIFLLCDQFIRCQHIKIRRKGYMDFYNETRFTSQLPFWVVCAWSALLLAVSTILRDHCSSEKVCAKSIHLTQAEYIMICIGLESLSLLIVIANYFYQVWRFNSNRIPSDVFRDEMMSCALDFSPDSMGRVDDEIFHRQADLIRYYKDRNVVLQRTILQLSRQNERFCNNPNA